MEKLAKVGIKVPEVLLPNTEIDPTKWAVVACDQYTSQPEYWEEAAKLIGDDASTLKVTFPEVYLEDDDADERIKDINKTMDEYLANNIFKTVEGFILLDRKTSHVPSRKGLIVALDLEEYDYSPESQSLIRATEGTIIDRLPPRVKIRENAAIELPHIMVLIDDPEKEIIEPLFEKDLEKVYDFELMMDSGHITGYKLEDKDIIEDVAEKLAKLADKENFEAKYNVKDKGVLLFAMGDGNHSLATAKKIWEEKKKSVANPAEIMDDPARYALVELVNVHDDGLQFEPIHRVVFNIDAKDMIDSMEGFFAEQGSEFSYELFSTPEELAERVEELRGYEDTHVVEFVTADSAGLIKIVKPKLNLEVGNLQAFIDKYIEDKKDAYVDYIHGDDVVYELGTKENNIGFLLPVLGKGELFKTVIIDGALPRKTFSMGEADEKRFYLEARKIK
jgi:hypothetical protein